MASKQLVNSALEALMSGDGKQALDVLKQWMTEAAGGGGSSAPDPTDSPALDRVDDPRVVDSVDTDDDDENGDQPGSEGDGAEGQPNPAAPPKKKKKSSIARVMREYGLTRTEAIACLGAGCPPKNFLALKRLRDKRLPTVKNEPGVTLFGGGDAGDVTTIRGGYGPSK